MTFKKKKFNCPAELTVTLLQGKWKVVILYNLRKSAKRFGELRRLTPGITQVTLTRQLKELESSGIVRRSVLGRDKLSGVEYELTPVGQELKPVLYAMIRWGLTNQKDYVSGPFVMVGR
ncbi:winged helix-turn-helix transcriptional regulator [Bdellovibrio sp. HCB274]|uniref:winged helix-turn-helix transcriptional regulator n=1 Tax=Bdellovibrio sp. HCB274 TaxID=3394361 RepID=UPI0039B5F6C2